MNHKPIIIGSAEARALVQRIERLESQMSAVLDALEAVRSLEAAIQTLCDNIEGHEARLNAMALMQPVAVKHEGKVNG